MSAALNRLGWRLWRLWARLPNRGRWIDERGDR